MPSAHYTTLALVLRGSLVYSLSCKGSLAEKILRTSEPLTWWRVLRCVTPSPVGHVESKPWLQDSQDKTASCTLHLLWECCGFRLLQLSCSPQRHLTTSKCFTQLLQHPPQNTWGNTTSSLFEVHWSHVNRISKFPGPLDYLWEDKKLLWPCSSWIWGATAGFSIGPLASPGSSVIRHTSAWTSCTEGRTKYSAVVMLTWPLAALKASEVPPSKGARCGCIQSTKLVTYDFKAFGLGQHDMRKISQ